MRRAFDIAQKDLIVWMRDPTALGILLGMPALLIVILGAALGGIMSGSGRIPVAIVNLDSRPYAIVKDQAAELEASLTDEKRIKALFTMERTRDLAGVEHRVANGDLAAALVIPEGFSNTLGQGTIKLDVLVDPGSTVSAGIWESIVRSVAVRYSAVVVVVRTTMEAVQRANSPALAKAGGAGAVVGFAITEGSRDDVFDAVKVTDTVSGGTNKVGAIDYYALSMTAMFLMFAAMFGAMSTVRERTEQTMARMLASPTARESIVGGKMLGVFILGITQFAVLFLFTKYLLNVWWGQSTLAIVMVAVAEVAAVTGLATGISAIAKTQRAIGGIAPLFIQIQAAIGGAFFQLDALPEWIQPIKYFSLVGWALEGWRAVQVQGAGLAGVMAPVIALWCFAIAFFAFGVWRMRAEQ
ncbi:MAG: ABC-2 transporter permease [Coriobacteriia bacterium]|nr:ABC-2 transporter permease [Coriobacteriia bacterium]